MWKVVWSKKVDKQLKRIPDRIVAKLRHWVVSIETRGMIETRLLPGLHDEPLQGKRFGQRSVRLNHAYRVIYVVMREQEIQIVEVIEVNKHEY